MLKNALFLLLFTLAWVTKFQAQISFEANFENGRLDSSHWSSGEFVLAPVTNLHFRIVQALNQTPKFKIYDQVGFQLRSYHQMVYRYENDSTWHFFDTTYKNVNVGYYHFHNQHPFTKDTVYIAYWHPYSYSDLQRYLNQISSSNYLLNSGLKGATLGGRNLYGYEITDTNYTDCYKSNVVITGRQHPIESINGYFIEGFTNYLLYSLDSIAVALRRNYRFFVYPMLNPDGVAIGSGQNTLGQGLNREWEDSLLSGGTPEIDTIRPVIWRETNQKVDWSIDIHSNPGSNIPYYWWGYTSASAVPLWQVSKASNYVQAVSTFDTSSTVNTSSYQNFIQGNGAGTAKTAANWFRRTFNAIAFTFEPTSEPMGFSGDNRYTTEQFKEAGVSLAKGFYAVQDTIAAFGGKVLTQNNLLVAQITGGVSPYTYAWTGPVSGNTDSIHASVPGTYSVSVTDSLGCLWSKSITRTSVQLSNFVIPDCSVYPNPTREGVNIKCPWSYASLNVSIFNLWGQLLDSQTIVPIKSNYVALGHFSSGFYILKVKSDRGYFTEKIQILK